MGFRTWRSCRHDGMQQVRARRRLTAGKFGRVRIVTVHAEFSIDSAELTIPIAARAAMHTRLPVAISRTVATSAQHLAVGKCHLVTVTRLQQRQVVFIMTIETVVVAPMAAMAHDDVSMFFGDNE